MADNKNLIQKADMALADLATAGRLTPEQTDRFLRKLIDTPTLLTQCRTVAMGAPEMKINKIGFGSRILRPATSSVALSAADRAKPDLGQVTLTTKEVIAEIRLPYDVLEDNIEGGNVRAGSEQGAGGLHQTIVELIAQRAALDLEELAIRGDVLRATAQAGPPAVPADSFLAMQDGFLKLANQNVVAATGAMTKDLIKAGVKAMPDKYLRDRARMIHFVSVDNETEMRDVYANRPTALGDAQVQGNLPLYVFGSQLKGVALMPTANGLFTDPNNLIFGIQRNIQIEYDKDITTRTFIIVLTARVAFQIEETEAVVKYTGITG